MIDREWALFLDRDGVINRRIVDGYVQSWEQFEFLPGVLESVKRFSGIFGRIIVVSNQQGVGKGLMTEADVEDIHRKMTKEISLAGGKIDAVYFSPYLSSENSFMRKPNVGMALRARKQFPAIRFSQSLMAGDSLSDMIFGKRAGMKTALISDNPGLSKKHPRKIDFIYPDLISLADALS
jgi:histidinol-phosphate phosphatase family protein